MPPNATAENPQRCNSLMCLCRSNSSRFSGVGFSCQAKIAWSKSRRCRNPPCPKRTATRSSTDRSVISNFLITSRPNTTSTALPAAFVVSVSGLCVWKSWLSRSNQGRSSQWFPRPAGTPENSPAFQRWENCRKRTSPVRDDRKRRSAIPHPAVPDGTRFVLVCVPTDESVGYSLPPYRAAAANHGT